MKYSSYYTYQKYCNIGGQGMIPVYPNVYSIDADETLQKRLHKANNSCCTDLPAIYRTTSGSPYCDSSYNKCVDTYYQVSYDNGETWEDVSSGTTIVEYDSTFCRQFRWVNMDINTDYICDECYDYRWVNLDPTIAGNYYCSGTTKLYKQQRQVSYDSGQTWSNVDPAEYQMGPIYQSNSNDCGYSARTRTQNVCIGFSKYLQKFNEVTYDYGNTWYTSSSSTTLVEGYSESCVDRCNVSKQYLTFIALGNSTLEINPNYGWLGDIDVSYDDGVTWQNSSSVAFSLSQGQRMLLKGRAKVNEAHIIIDGNCAVWGNPLSFYNSSEFEAYRMSGTTPSTYNDSFAQGLFKGSTGLTNIDYLYLPVLSEIPNNAYRAMFSGCTSLTSVPSDLLYSDNIGAYCYRDMFADCTSLVTPPELPATTLSAGCYERMFYGCTSLTTAPYLPAWQLYSGSGDGCYANMFENCTSLNYIKCNAIYLGSSNSLYNWVYGVSPTGTFVKPASTSWPTGSSGIPYGWTIQNM